MARAKPTKGTFTATPDTTSSAAMGGTGPVKPQANEGGEPVDDLSLFAVEADHESFASLLLQRRALIQELHITWQDERDLSTICWRMKSINDSAVHVAVIGAIIKCCQCSFCESSSASSDSGSGEKRRKSSSLVRRASRPDSLTSDAFTIDDTAVLLLLPLSARLLSTAPIHTYVILRICESIRLLDPLLQHSHVLLAIEYVDTLIQHAEPLLSYRGTAARSQRRMRCLAIFKQLLPHTRALKGEDMGVDDDPDGSARRTLRSAAHALSLRIDRWLD